MARMDAMDWALIIIGTLTCLASVLLWFFGPTSGEAQS
jgi:hypothetical protein